MPRVIGIDPGTVSIDVCGLDDGRLFLDRSVPTADALADPARLVGLPEEEAGPLDLVAGPSGYGPPLTPARGAPHSGPRPAPLAAAGGAGGSGGGGAGGGGAPFRGGGGWRALLLGGGAAPAAGGRGGREPVGRLAHPATPQERVASEAFIESAVKTAVALALSVPGPAEFVLSGRLARVEAVSGAIRAPLEPVAPTPPLAGVAAGGEQAAPGAAARG